MCLGHIPEVAVLFFLGGGCQKFQRSGSGREETSEGKGNCGHHEAMYERGRKA